MYYPALGPEEAAALSKHHLSLPDERWGELHLERARPEIAPEWTDSQSWSEERGLKHRDPSGGRTVSCPPELTALLYEHLDRYGMAPDGRLFRATRHEGRIGSNAHGRTWTVAQAAVFTPDIPTSRHPDIPTSRHPDIPTSRHPDIPTSPLAKKPYDLCHAAVST